MKLSRTFDLLHYQLTHSPSDHAVNVREGGQWRAYSSQELCAALCRYAGLLERLGIKPGAAIMLLPKAASLPCLMLDLAAQHLGITVVLVHSSTRVEQFSYMLTEIQPACIVLQDAELSQRFAEVLTGYSYFQVEGNAFREALSQGKPMTEAALQGQGEGISEAHLSTIVYTSGTAGIPKGVMLSHGNIMSNVTALAPLLPLDNNHRVLSFLPYSHVFERTTLYTYLCLGVNIYFIEHPQNLPADAKALRPHLFSAVPYIIEQMYQHAYLEKAQQKRLGRYLLAWALKQGLTYREEKGWHPVEWGKMLLCRLLIFRRFRRALGGKLKAIVVGAAYMNPEISRSFALAGIPIREGYGLTETSPAISVNRMKPGLNRYGTVGLPLPGVYVKIDAPQGEEVGEILVKGPNVMMGYFNNREATQAVFTAEGWLRTGDMGRFVDKRFLQITDRKKDLFKTSSGKYIAPQVLEAHFRQSLFIDQILVIGFQRPFLTALILPDFTSLKAWANEVQVHWTSPPYMVLNIKVKAKIQEELDQLNQPLPGHERVQAFHLIHRPWTQDSGELSHTLKPIREEILKNYAREIDALYVE